MDVKKLIEATREGISIDRILHAVRQDREDVSRLPEDQLDFLESAIVDMYEGVTNLKCAVDEDDLARVKEVIPQLQELLTMVLDSCDEQS